MVTNNDDSNMDNLNKGDSSKKLNNPHNNFCKWGFQRLKNIVFFFEMIFSSKTFSKFHFETLSILDTVSIDDSLKENRSDLFVELEYGVHRELICSIVEHKSNVDKNAVQQMLKYNILYQNSKGSKDIIRIISILLHHGGKFWPVEWRSIEGLLKYNIEKKLKKNKTKDDEDYEELDTHSVKFEPLFVDLKDIDDSDVKGDAVFKLFFLSLKYAFSSTEDFINAYFNMFCDYDPEKDGVLTQVEKNVFMKYIQGIRSEEDQKKIVDAFNNAKNITPLGGSMKTAIELLDESLTALIMERAEEEAEERGKEEERNSIARNMKAGGVSIELIAGYTGLSLEEINKL